MDELHFDLRIKYANNPYILQKLDAYLANLPGMLQAAEEEQIQREIRRVDAKKKRITFIQYFLNVNSFFYISQTETFVQYVDQSYIVVSEDDITHLILKNVNVDRELATWKYKIKIQILKRIKETGLLDVNPDSSAVRLAVRSLWPSVFTSKTIAKYFLTILGDLLRGNRGITYFLDQSYKPFIHVINDHISTTLNKHIMDDFKFKYASQPFSNCRTIPGHTTDKPFKFNVFALAAVATHYSRTCCADDFLKTCDDPEFATIVFGLKEHTPATLVSGFLSEYTVHDATGLIRIKDLHFLWRVFMRSKSLPNVISSINLKHILTEMNVLDNTETCRGLSPTQTPAVLNFKYFWDTYVIKDESNSFEVTELAELYNSWCEGKYLHLSLDACQTWLNSTLVNGKARVRCLLWNKSADIENAKEAFRHLPEYSDNLDEQYTFYCSYTKRFSKMLVTRDYFNLN